MNSLTETLENTKEELEREEKFGTTTKLKLDKMQLEYGLIDDQWRKLQEKHSDTAETLEECQKRLA